MIKLRRFTDDEMVTRDTHRLDACAALFCISSDSSWQHLKLEPRHGFGFCGGVYFIELTSETQKMTPTESLIHLAISHQTNTAALAEIKTVACKLMEGIKPTVEDMGKLALAYQRDPIMCTLDYQDLCDFIESKFGE